VADNSGHLMDHPDPTPVSGASRPRLLDILVIPFGQRLRGDFRQISGPGLSPSPGRWRLKSLLTLPFNVFRATLTSSANKDKQKGQTL
jgi:hypothetical protein